VGTFTVTRSAGAVLQTGPAQVQVRGGAARLVDDSGGITIEAGEGATLLREQHGLRVLQGEVVLEVRRRRPDEAAAVVLVSHGAIEVLGTRFTVIQSTAGGTVALHEGSIRFRAQDGQVRTLEPGQSLSWPLQPLAAAVEPAQPPQPEAGLPEPPAVTPGELAARTPAEAAPAPGPEPRRPVARQGSPGAQTAPAPPAPVPLGEDEVASLIDDVNTLRRLGRYAEAASRLEGGLAHPLPSRTQERLTAELGSILTWNLRDAPRACKVWQAHRSLWPQSSYQPEIERAEAALGCSSPDGTD
jgi:transmembrane sensor